MLSGRPAPVVHLPISQTSIGAVKTRAIQTSVEKQAEALEAIRVHIANGDFAVGERETMLRQADVTQATALKAVRRWDCLLEQQLAASNRPSAEKA